VKDEHSRLHRLDRMTEADLPRVLEIERLSFDDPWSRGAFLHEIRVNRVALNLVLRSRDADARVDAYACIHCVLDEAEINNIAVHPDCRRQGLGRLLMQGILDEVIERGCRVATLQVRPANAPARDLYRRFGFIECGLRRRYYASGEDALIMIKPLLS
jgi:ribosomal-protein-alanine N-acetyltransferase